MKVLINTKYPYANQLTQQLAEKILTALRRNETDQMNDPLADLVILDIRNHPYNCPIPAGHFTRLTLLFYRYIVERLPLHYLAGSMAEFATLLMRKTKKLKNEWDYYFAPGLSSNLERDELLLFFYLVTHHEAIMEMQRNLLSGKLDTLSALQTCTRIKQIRLKREGGQTLSPQETQLLLSFDHLPIPPSDDPRTYNRRDVEYLFMLEDRHKLDNQAHQMNILNAIAQMPNF